MSESITGTKLPPVGTALSAEDPRLDRLQSDLDDMKRQIGVLLERLAKHEARRPRGALRDGASALESASESILALLTTRAWLDARLYWVREIPLVSVIGSALFGWTLASVIRRVSRGHAKPAAASRL